ncbi:hypothetical protein BASA83_013272 [Batrachochytrium salamandrivorans]|nr:hypothetical protein BASA83_013272 [Batrachochytrium salamandrivorans]
MKLISFAAISFLAITVSAHTRLSAVSQGAGAPSEEQSQGAGAPSEEQSQDATGQNAQQPQVARIQSLRQQHKQSLQAGSEILRQKHEEKINEVYKIGDHIKEMEKEKFKLREAINGLDDDSPERNGMMARLMSLSLDIEDANASLKIVMQDMRKIEERYNIATKKLEKLNESQQ